MPSFDYLILSAPVGFVKGCSLLSTLSTDADQFNEVVSQALNGASSETVFRIEEKKTVGYILKARLLATPKPSSSDIATALDSSTILSSESIASLVASIESFYGMERSVSTAKVRLFKTPDINQLVLIKFYNAVCQFTDSQQRWENI